MKKSGLKDRYYSFQEKAKHFTISVLDSPQCPSNLCLWTVVEVDQCMSRRDFPITSQNSLLLEFIAIN